MTDYCSIDDIKNYLGAGTSTADDALLDSLATRSSRYLDNYCGRLLVAGSSASYTFDYEHSQRLFFSPYEFATVTAVTNGDGNALTIGTDLRTMPKSRGATDPITWLEMYEDSGKIFLPTNSGRKQDAITVTGTLGMLAAVDEFLKHCAIRLAVYLYRVRDTASSRAYAQEIGTVYVREALSEDERDTLKGAYRKVLVA